MRRKCRPSLTVDNKATLTNAPAWVTEKIKETMTVENPDHIKAKRYSKNGRTKIPKHIKLYETTENGIAFPRGWARDCRALLDESGVDYTIVDNRRTLNLVQFQFTGSLHSYQQEAVDSLSKRDFGHIEAPTGSGKTVIALALVAKREQPTLILVHTQELMYQWRDRIKSFLGVDAGMVGDGKYDIQPITVGMVQTVRKYLDTLPQYFGHLILDEAHHVPAKTFTETIQAFDCMYLLGLSATPYRVDGLTKLIHYTIGNKAYTISKKILQKNGSIAKPKIINKATNFKYNYKDDYIKMINNMINNEERNKQIVNDVTKEVQRKAGTALIVSDRVDHCNVLSSMFNNSIYKAQVLTGTTNKTNREQIINDLHAGKIDVLISTNSLIGEGFDYKGFTSLFLATPIKSQGKLIQSVGRILRPNGKQPVVYNYIDKQVKVLRKQANQRNKALQQLSK